MKQNIISLIIIAFGAICVAQLTIQITHQCECSQFSQNSCGTQYSDQSCFWNSTSQVCQRKGCQQLYSQETCLQNFAECYWNGSKCQQFTSCSQLTYQNMSCTQQNIQCGQFASNSTNCLPLDQLPQCTFFNQDQCTPQQIGYQGTLCVYSNITQQCQTATSCSQLQTQSQCTQWKNTCQWDPSFNECVQLQCNNFTNQSTCTNIIFGLNPQTIMPCQFYNGTCQQVYSAQSLNAQECSSVTLSTHYWIQANNNTGTCIPCNILNTYQPNNKCSCSSFLSEQCQSSNYCQWSNGQCNPVVCNQILDQLTCIQNLECSWQNNQCQIFQGCPPASSHQYCIESSFNCLIYNQTSCQSLSENSCSRITYQYLCQSQLGYCYWSGNQCKQVQTCNQITQQRLCYRFGYACTWENGRCQQLTCNKIQFQNNCIYTIPQLYTNDVQPCIWQNGKCQNLNSVNSLDAAQCQSISFDTYKWTGSRCVKCIEFQQQIQSFLQLPNQCQCYQLFTYQQCQQISYCQWTGVYCQPYLCSNISNQASCASNPNCFWINNQCETFKQCNILQGASQSECIVQSINCPSSDGTYCQDKQHLLACSSYPKQNLCQYALGSNGICLWQSNSCQVLSKCSQINTQSDCQYFKKQCYWSTSCQPVSCSHFQTASTCQFYYTSINSYNTVPCQWNSTTGVCTQPTDYMTQLNSNNCQTNTNKGARWSQALNICLSCQAPKPPNPNQCSCSQLISQINCMQSLQCQWNTQTNSCQQLPCTNLSQQLCIQNSQCMWNGSCQQFTSCSSLKGTTSAECAAQSLYCSYYNLNKKQCQVASKAEIQDCWGVTQENCYFFVPPSYYCGWNPTLNQCYLYNQAQCQNYYSQSQCQSIPYCYYQNGCQLKQCQHFYTKESCTFTFDPQNLNNIQSCSWLNGACIPANNLFSEQTCFTNTDQTARWSSNIKDGFCIPCNLPLQQLIVPKNQCLCSQILTSEECYQTSCNWNGSICEDYWCGRLNQIDCIQSYQCYWMYSTNSSQGGYCEYLEYKELIYQKDPCTRLRGNNSLECLSQSLLCPVSLNGICQNRALLQTCQSMNTLQLCSNGIGQEGYCTYENQQCQILTSCSQLKTQTECSVFNKSCQFVTTSGRCEQLSCSSYTSLESCTYIFQNINKANIQACIWNVATKTCSSASYLIQQTYQNCYSNTGGTYHWSSTSTTQGSCVSCQLNRFKPKNTCSCTLLNQVECTLSKPVCKLNQNNECVKSQCNEIFDSVHCSQQNECMWNQNQCVTFTKCTDLSGTTNLDCVAQSLQCQATQNGICQPASSLNSCEKYSQSQCKLGKLGSEGFCYFNETKNACQVISSCDSVNNIQYCEKLNPACKWSYNFNKCVPYQCQDYRYEEECINVIVNLQDPQIELCVWQNYKCVPFVDTYYKFDDAICYVKSDHTYRWVKEDKFGVRCQQCLQAYLINIIAIVLLIYI